MKAIAYSAFGPPDVLALAELPVREPKDREVLIKVRAAALNPLDWHFLRGEPGLMRLMGKPNNKVPGVDVAGHVEALGAKVTSLRAGDEVFGNCDGACAEYACAREDRLARKPARLSFEQAAAIPVAACTGLIALRDHGRVQPNQTVLINGAAGGIGTFSVQLAKAFGGVVTGVCSTRNLELVRSIGADQVIDYTAEDFTLGARRYDLILHVAGNRSVPELKKALAPNGTLVMVGAGAGREPDGGDNKAFLALLRHQLKKPFLRFARQRVHWFVAQTRRSDLAFLADLAEAGKLTPIVGRTYALTETAEAMRHLETGHARGKIVVKV
jgi:NADPH:quinone reductase-like Zn-dependent oxidoreductase